MKLFKEKLALLSPIIALAVVFIFALILIPSAKSTPKLLPIAIVNLDKGLEITGQPKMNLGETIVEKVQSTSSQADGEAVKWVVVDNVDDVKKLMDSRDCYAALIIPSDFSAKQATFRTLDPVNPEIEIMVNQGANAMASTAANQILNTIVDGVGATVRTQILDGVTAQNGSLTPKQAASLVMPITKKMTNYNEIGTKSMNGVAPVSLFQPVWIGSILGAMLFFLVSKKWIGSNRKENLKTLVFQLCLSAVVALFVGFGLTWLAEHLLGLAIPHFIPTFLFIALSCLAFILMIASVLLWVGFPGVGIFALLMFFGGPLLALAPEFMPNFYQNWIYPWLPMRFLVDGLRDLLFFDNGTHLSGSIIVLVGIILVSILIIVGAIFKKSAAFNKAVAAQ